jgi:hypothetical protein
VIGADGNPFYVPPAEPPAGEGEIELTIEATLPPPNDDFAAAIPIHMSQANENPFEEPTGDAYFLTQVHGYNWGATTQPEEPAPVGEPGASVWYSWTPPGSGEVRMNAESGGQGHYVATLYQGTELTGLSPVASWTSGEYPGFEPAVTGGVEYRIAVDGVRPEPAAEPHVGSFSLSIEERVPPVPSSSPTGPSDGPTAGAANADTAATPPPTVKLGGHRVDAAKGTATFRFSSSTAGAKFRCKVDKKSYKACSSPYLVKGLKPGKHRFEVVAGYDGKLGKAPAVVNFTVPAAQRQRHLAG